MPGVFFSRGSPDCGFLLSNTFSVRARAPATWLAMSLHSLFLSSSTKARFGLLDELGARELPVLVGVVVAELHRLEHAIGVDDLDVLGAIERRRRRCRRRR